MPRSILLGRPWPQPGEPLFTEEDTAYALALAEEERDTCPSCGLLKTWCREPSSQFSFEAHEERCWATYTVAAKRDELERAGMHGPTRHALQLSPRFREGKDPEIDAGLDLDVEVD